MSHKNGSGVLHFGKIGRRRSLIDEEKPLIQAVFASIRVIFIVIIYYRFVNRSFSFFCVPKTLVCLRIPNIQKYVSTLVIATIYDSQDYLL